MSIAVMSEVLRVLIPAAEADWRDRALCAETDPEAFFPELGGPTAPAKRICRACEVRPECLEYALERDEPFGIYGGFSGKERRRIQRLGLPVADVIADDEAAFYARLDERLATAARWQANEREAKQTKRQAIGDAVQKDRSREKAA